MKRSKEKITLSILLAAVLVVGIVGYMIYVQHQFYTESTKNLLETYEQVDKTFTMFAQRNWNVLSEWGSNLQEDADGEAVRASLSLFNQQKPTWKYTAACTCSTKTAPIWMPRAAMARLSTSGAHFPKCTPPDIPVWAAIP